MQRGGWEVAHSLHSRSQKRDLGYADFRCWPLDRFLITWAGARGSILPVNWIQILDVSRVCVAAVIGNVEKSALLAIALKTENRRVVSHLE